MAFRMLLVHAYALLQLYVLAIRSTVTFRALRYMFLVGAISCLPAAIILASLASHYFAYSPRLPLIKAAIEEVVKILPALYLLWRTRIGASSSPVDGLIYCAAAGAGFGFGEDAIHMIENASIAYTPYTTVWSALSSWLPGGWANGELWFPGHLALAALSGVGIGVGRRLFASRALRALAVLVTLGWSVFVHAQFNAEISRAPASFASFTFFTLNGGGHYVGAFVFAALLLLILADERIIRPRAARESGLAAPSVFADIAACVDSLGSGLRALGRVRRMQRWREERLQLQWELSHLTPQSRDRLMTQISDVSEQEQRGTAADERPGQLGFWSPRSYGPLWNAYRIAVLPVMAYGFWLVFISPEHAHASTQQIAGSALVEALGWLGLALMFFRFGYFVRSRKSLATPADSSELAVVNCQAILMWSGFITCLATFKDLYDAGTLPYPLRADAHAKAAQAKACLGTKGFDDGAITTQSPVHTVPKRESGEASLTDDRP